MGDSQIAIFIDNFDKKCILVVKDDPTISRMLQEILEDLGGYRVLPAANGYQALNLIRSTKPDLFLFDYHLPGMSGMDLYSLLHADRAYVHIPVLFLSVNASVAAFQHEHFPFLRKLFGIDDLLLTTEELLTS